MINTQIDTKQLKDAGQDILSLSKEYNEIIDTIYDKINGYSQSGIWQGKSAENYIQSVVNEKNTYIMIGKIIKSYGNALLEHAENYENYILERELDG